MISNSVYKELTTTRKLNTSGSNFFIWKSKMDFVLTDIGVSYVLTEPKPEDSTESTPTEQREKNMKWVTDDFTCRHAIFTAMEEDNLMIVFDRYGTAKEIMDALTNLFGPKSGRDMGLCGKYMKYKMNEETRTTTNVMDHVFEMCAMVRKLELMGIDVPELMQVFVLMLSLPESWKSAMDLFMRMDGDDLRLMSLIGFIRDEAEIREYDGNEGDGDGDVVVESAKKKRKKVGEFNGNCYGRGKNGRNNFGMI